MVRLSQLQLFFYGKKKNTLRDVTVHYKDGVERPWMKEYCMIEDSLGGIQTKANGSGRVSFYEVSEDIDFDRIENIHIKLSTGEDITLEKVERK